MVNLCRYHFPITPQILLDFAISPYKFARPLHISLVRKFQKFCADRTSSIIKLLEQMSRQQMVLLIPDIVTNPYCDCFG